MAGETGDNFVGGLFGHGLNVHTAFGGGDDDGLRGFAVEDDGEVVLMIDVAGFGEIECLYLASGGAGLGGDEGVAEHGSGGFEGGFGAVNDFDTSLIAIGKGAFAASACMNLCLDDNGLFGVEGGDSLINFCRCGGGIAIGHGDSVVF